MSLFRRLKTVLWFYKAEQQQQVFINYLSTSRMMRWTYRFYKLFNAARMGHYILAIHGLRTTAQIFPSQPLEGELLALATSHNYQKNIGHIATLTGLKPIYIQEAETKGQRFKNLIKTLTLLTQAEGISNLRTILNIIKRVDRKDGWILGLNASIFLFNYIVFKQLFSASNKAIITANDFSPAPLALRAAAESRGLVQVFTMHGQISSYTSGNIFPRLDYDIACLYGLQALESYRQSGEPVGKIFLTGFPGESSPIRHLKNGNITTIGIVLANFFDADTLSAINKITSLYPETKILVRLHPQTPYVPELSKYKNIEVCPEKDIQHFGQACDFIIAGNTGAQIDLLKGGTPVMYYDGLDKLGQDDLGLVKSEVIPAHKDSPTTSDMINSFFDESWIEKFRSYDASYLSSRDQVERIGNEIFNYYKNSIS